jgi:16S rRNA (guanine527-N7)-methyltransferase
MMSDPLWTELAARASIRLEKSQQQQLERYLDLLLAANARMNLTRITDPAAARLLHVGDALTLLPQLPPRAHRVADVGSGGGVPGMILAIARPDAAVTLVESTRKKAEFLRQCAAELGLENVTVEPRRAEELGQSAARESFDVVVARAVATLAWLAEWMLPLAARGGVMLAMKGPKGAAELTAARGVIRMLGGDEGQIIPANLPGAEGHVIVKVVKISRTNPRFPRAASVAKGEPIDASKGPHV